MEKVLQYGNWRLVIIWGGYRILHRCKEAAYSWDEPGYHWAAVSEGFGKCVACETAPPDKLQGFINLLKWEI